MLFPFLTCEVNCGIGGLDIADRQNARSMTIAVRAIVNLFRMVGREKELHRTILAFSVSHDQDTVRIYGHYPVIDGKEATYWHHQVDMFNFVQRNGQDKWTTYRFTQNVYHIWMPTQLDRISSAIEDLRLYTSSDSSSLASSRSS